ncbi:MULTISPECIES: adenine phosphoribosyltransferase [Sporomusa]|jgi:adenine phosphoribosyltransferase|uniref:Adenine phosphoribosyltransferase n=2 Tax=Sporomusa TaxID=2375 RepID=A0ABM9W3A5_9FIRM|nr:MULTISPECIES: adenine phosphoribosyltransferase [Sporomusa]MCM0757256.1 adenine phosphoribosyltransferase [Sporomusa sphaeroides DSM 2875]OLS58459.1 adenine phosphoribosyltransferase [Sporomusa sphaeroides DSM 2875]CVK19599.1 Adenine phosphoribosyltransferase [Sporomusa sphaeroides DSM 2875]SCM80179.1 adenine phosphoribosyltransferase [uncultured Sporomusa sp.]HML34285.1 adenine phosphoribosyltransferase [Sporomusa sphaeroides]
MDLQEKIRNIPDFPQPGIQFKDITTLLKDGKAFRLAIDRLAEPYKQQPIDIVIGPEARGFAVGAPVAYVLGAGFVPVRKPGKLPAEIVSYEYSLEYGKGSLEIHKDAIVPGSRVLIVDDLLATGGTTLATIKMVEQLGGTIVGLAFLVELSFLNGRQVLTGYDIGSLIQY